MMVVDIVEFMAWLSTCLCYCCRGEYSYDDDCQSYWILCGIRWNNGLIKGDFGELLGYHRLDMWLILGMAFVAAVFAALFIGVQVMFEIREDEKRRGINLRCWITKKTFITVEICLSRFEESTSSTYTPKLTILTTIEPCRMLSHARE